jgi:hypothetical protein
MKEKVKKMFQGKYNKLVRITSILTKNTRYNTVKTQMCDVQKKLNTSSWFCSVREAILQYHMGYACL